MPVEAVPITSETQWLEMRRGNVGASEIGALFGVHDYCTAFGLAARKQGKIPDTIDSDVLKRGRMLEPVAMKLLAEDRPDWHQEPAGCYYHDPDIRLGCTPDLFVTAQDGRYHGVVQIKTVAPQIFADKWHNADGVLEPPLWIALQAMAEQHLTGADFAVIAVLVVSFGLSLEVIEVPTLPSVIEQMRSKVVSFWELVDAGELPPPDYGTDGKILAQILHDDDGTEIDLSADNELPGIVEMLESMKDARRDAEDKIAQYQAKILHRIGNAERARFAGGMITAKTVNRREYLVPASSYRPLRVKFHRGHNEVPT
jgi:predicted phage-related endonuclease